MGMADEAAVIAALKDPSNRNAADYQILFKKIYDINLAVINTTNVNASVLDAYDKLAQAIGEFEKSVAFAPFTSKFDQVMIEKATFTDAEARGWAVFNGKGNCAACHPAPAVIKKIILPILLTTNCEFPKAKTT